MTLAIIDVWTLGHIAAGAFFALLTDKFWRVAFVAALWEWFENAVVSSSGFGDPWWGNSLCDIAAALLAFYAARLAFSAIDQRAPRWVKNAVDE